MSSVLNSLNFRPSSESGKFSVVFFNQGRYSERRFQTKEQADDLLSIGWRSTLSRSGSIAL